MSILICLIGGQQAPNLFAVEQCRPQKIILVHSEDTESDASDFQSFLSSRGYEDIRLWKVDPYHPGLITKAAQQLRGSLSGEEVILNYTGGTKPMAIGFYQIFRDQTLLYVDTQGETFWWGEGDTLLEKPVELYVDLPVLLQLQGAQIGSQSDHNMINYLKPLVNYLYTTRTLDLPQNGRLRQMNNEVVKARQDGRSKLWKPEYDDGKLSISETDVHKVKVTLNSLVFEIKNKDFWLNFFAGGWFEQWVYLTLKNAGVYDDVRCNVTLSSRSGGNRAKNEIDVAAIYNGIPVFIECKTGIIAQEHITNLYATKKNYGHAYTLPVLITLAEKIDKVLEEKIKDYGILHLNGADQIERELTELHNFLIVQK